jgi:hypothetical protein
MPKFHLNRSAPYAWCGATPSQRHALRNWPQFRSLPHYLRCGSCLRCYLAAATLTAADAPKGDPPCSKNK